MNTEKQFNFMGKRYIALGFSIILILVSIGSLAVKGLSFGLDFTGGTLVEVGYEQKADINNIREQLHTAGFDSPIVQYFGEETDVLIRLQQGKDSDLGARVLDSLKASGDEVQLRRIEFVGPQVGEELKQKGGLAMIMALAVVMFYVAMRFQVKFAIGAVSALAHDVIITLGMFSLFGWEFDLTVLAAVLAVIGYSLNDTIVVADRIRENFRLMRKSEPLEIINVSLTQTLSRTLVTSLTTLLVLLVLLFAGGELIHGFAMALSIGVLIGTYSSIYVAANILLMMHISKEDLIFEEKEEEVENLLP